MDGRYEPIAIEEVETGVLQGYSATLGLFVRWERGELRWHDRRRGRKYPLSSRSGRAGWPNRKPGWRPRPGSGSWRRNWHRDKKRDKQPRTRFKAPQIPGGDPRWPPRPGILQSGPSRAADQVIPTGPDVETAVCTRPIMVASSTASRASVWPG